jgi:hypothetical protein
VPLQLALFRTRVHGKHTWSERWEVDGMGRLTCQGSLAGLPSLLDGHVYLGEWAQINQKLVLDQTPFHQWAPNELRVVDAFRTSSSECLLICYCPLQGPLDTTSRTLSRTSASLQNSTRTQCTVPLVDTRGTTSLKIEKSTRTTSKDTLARSVRSTT